MDKKQLIAIENLEKWLHELAFNNIGCPVEDMAAACEIIIDRLPGMCTYAKEVSDTVEVVRCKDCKHYSVSDRQCGHPDGLFLTRTAGDNPYCSYGERRQA